ncbi:aldehyde dehydrogenase (NAD+) [Kroppenstedtia sanguinis]|uniref:aldehyde dehydrogenase family protein n=1 Tax=Kroppenstedtia sanguinis TaxID=1380684 RepID=UPI003D1E8F80
MDLQHWNKSYIDGSWRDGNSQSLYQNINPFTQQPISEIRLATAEDLDTAYQAAARVQKEWEQTSAYNWAAVMEKAAELMVERAEELIEILIAETGSTRIKANIEAKSAFTMLKMAARNPFKMETTIHPSFVNGKENRVYRKPIGVIGIISPFNFPFILSLRAVATSLSTGNGVVLKPDSQTYISGGLFLAKLFEDAGLPKGLFNVITAEVEEIGDAFVEHPVPRLISFTGSTHTGRHIAQLCGKHLKKSHLELGGNNPFLVLEDANVHQAVQAAIFGKYLHQGQICMSINRLLVHKNLYGEFVELFVNQVKNLKVGNPDDPDTFIGPMINHRAAERIRPLIDKSVDAGAQLALEGKIYDNFIEPFVLTDVTSEMEIVQNEIFGPVACLIPVESDEEALRIANDTPYGLSTSIFTSSIEQGVRLAQQIESGIVHINDQTVNDEPNIPFGGVKDSGYGRYGGEGTQRIYDHSMDFRPARTASISILIFKFGKEKTPPLCS